jgi:Opacity protein and related surface antigens
MKSRAIIGLCLLVGSIPAAAIDEGGGLYVSTKFVASYALVDGISTAGTFPGTVSKQDVTDAVAGGAVAFGYAAQHLRTELEYVFRYRFDLNTNVGSAASGISFRDNVQTQSVMVNLLWDFKNSTRFTPYLGAGIGYARNDSDTELTEFASGNTQSKSTAQDNFAWSLMAGLLMNLGTNWKFEMGYRYVDLGVVKSGPFDNGARLTTDSLRSNDFSLGFRYQF